ncbi:P22 phage major capsid protein family protein [Amycolatopsis sp. NPDC059027]|uniref:P22 phage major capsid protein family protein n=1 Tax=Amycolatopsis sp. NPDC059027 TaxID=3346709 RepID=UPI0036712B81
MAYTTSVNPLKAEQIAAAALGLLQRDIILPGLVWRNAAGDFRGAKNDTISFRVPALPGAARTANLRPDPNDAAGRLRTLDSLAETKVDVTLTKDIYKGTTIDDEVLTLDITDFGAQVLNPLVQSVAYGVEDLVATTMSAATYATGHNLTYTLTDDPYDVLLDARTVLNKRHVPQDGRVVVCGAAAENWILKSDHLNQFEQSGSDNALRNAQIGRLAGNTVVTSLALPDNDIYVFHRTAFILSTMAPAVPSGASFGTSTSYAGLALRFIRDYDAMHVQDRAIVDTYAGSNVVVDDLGLGNGTKGLVRAVKITLAP